MMTLLEAARHDPPLFKLRYEESFIIHLQQAYFPDVPKEIENFNNTLWNALESAAENYFRTAEQGILQPDVKAAKQVLEKLEPVIRDLDDGKNFQSVTMGFSFLLDRIDVSGLNDTQKEMLKNVRNLIFDGRNFKALLTSISHVGEAAKKIKPPTPFRKSDNNALKVWSVCTGIFWTESALKKITVTKENVTGGVIITSEFGRFAEECLSQIGVEARYSLRTPIEYARNHLIEDNEFQRLIAIKEYEALAKHLANRKDRIPIAMVQKSVL
ncbi:hypothetical protein [Hyphococcus sp.]|uniref:hypothetical protein n=1 Tax=Hyphococcus sp. TaxID=2038636 RepID=UPI003CCB7BD3